MSVVDMVWTGIAFVLTLMVLSYAFLGDNPIFRIATYAFIGMAASYVVLITFTQVIWPKFILEIIRPDVGVADKALLLVPLLFSLLLLGKASPHLARLGTLPMAFLVGVGAAAMIGGVVLGTLIPQVVSAISAFDLQSGRAQTTSQMLAFLEAVVLLAGTATTLLYFNFTSRVVPGPVNEQGGIVRNLTLAGKYFIAITLGALFAGVYASALTALIERLTFLWKFIS
jgi:hypothetical protein